MASCNDIHESKEHISKEVVVIVVPLPAQGHLNQLLQLSCLLSSYGLQVHFVSSAIYNRQAKLRANGLDMDKLHFHDLPTPAFQSPPPNPNSTNKFPTQLQPAWYAMLSLRQLVAEYVEHMSKQAKRVVIIHDPVMAAVVQEAIPNAESYAFNCVSAYYYSSFVWESLGKPFPIEQPKNLPSFKGCVPDEVFKFVALQEEPLKYRAGYLFNTCRDIEGPYVDLLEREEVAENRKLWAIGPILPSKSLSANSQHKCLEWLDKQAPKSVIYVSFGTMTSLSDEEIKEQAIGLEQSKQKFIWVLRDADKANVFDGEVRRPELPDGFEERVVEFGTVVRDWAPQPEILSHPSTGGFMSHCGWNSCLESITMGVPIAAWPMHSDQPRNAVLITEILKTGLIVREWERREELVKASTIENIVRRLMASEEGNTLRKQAEELAAVVRRSTEEGGTSKAELDSFIAHITRHNMDSVSPTSSSIPSSSTGCNISSHVSAA
ncbi:zeatin O-glucosyltransferase-like [Olea europaea subsp. europaea]|uniref:Glycosyltransferase n=1 Tax=Olea europaea subsp. europaea TaxID=158383 RepID=A0A8S0UJ59_OLEEU|nr:zeatin O-glucosyltransferase-like [Olea europaea subsp. europaea]